MLFRKATGALRCRRQLTDIFLIEKQCRNKGQINAFNPFSHKTFWAHFEYLHAKMCSNELKFLKCESYEMCPMLSKCINFHFALFHITEGGKTQSSQHHNKYIMTSSNENIFRVTLARSYDVSFDVRLNKRLSKQSRRRWFESPSR